MSREWNVIVYGFEMHPHRVVADNRGAARWASFKAAREAGYFTDFHEFLISSRVVANPPKEGG